ncbi:HNH endonuclease [Corynebacterium kalinowskii]|uniref:HNH endonuclease n=1 Tax=Corynebacterium kalinowskii TaxID=2675216 RepID=A0A6B8VXI0_9CORY|nr:HNH endonuclease signature motif containing protein [Corynebacterium kalinowskii]QGU02000.1 HNH endonuclease [Corynebacterium kalinowskii]
MIAQATQILEQALVDDHSFESFGDLLRLKEVVARLETRMAAGKSRRELEKAGASASEGYRIERRANNWWNPDVPVEHQDLILGALDKLSPSSERRTEIYQLAAAAALKSTPRQTHEYTKKLVRQENEELAQDPFEAYRQRRFSLGNQDEHGGCKFNGYAPAATAALFKALIDQAFRTDQATRDEDEDRRTITQREADAFEQVLRWASSDRRSHTGHCSLIVSVTEWDEFDWQVKFGTNVGLDLNLMDVDYLSGDKVIDYIQVHDHNGAVKALVTASRSANFHQRLSLFGRDGVCQHPGCNVPASRCDAHHVVPWSRGGPTSIDNLALLCPKHHRLIDDSWLEDHLEMELGRAVMVQADGTRKRNESPAAQQAGGWQVVYGHPTRIAFTLS